MSIHFKEFDVHSQYETYINGQDAVLPNVSECKSPNEVHYNNVKGVIYAKFVINEPNLIYIDKFLANDGNFVEQEFDNDVEAAKEYVVNDVDEFYNNGNGFGNIFLYQNEMFEIGNKKYYLWKISEYSGNINYILTETNDFVGLSLEDDIDSEFYPYVYALDDDYQVIYNVENGDDYQLHDKMLVAYRYRLKLCNDTDYFEKIIINNAYEEAQSEVDVTPGTYYVKYVLANEDYCDLNMFVDCPNLVSIYIPKSIEDFEIGVGFNSCDNLASIVVDKENPYYDSRGNCNAIIKKSDNSLTYGCKNTVIPYGVESIDAYAFEYCKNLTSIVIPDSVTDIMESAFDGCNNLTSVVIGSGVTDINNNTFNGCGNIKKVTINSDTISSISWSTNGLKLNSLFGGNVEEMIFGNGVITVGNYAMKEAATLKSVKFSNTVTTINTAAFQYCSGLTEVELPSSLTKMYTSAFSRCTGLKEVVIPNSVTTFGSSIFYNCTGLTKVTLPNTLTTIPVEMFYGCTSLVEVNIPNTVTTVGNSAFWNCSVLGDVTLPSTVTSIGTNAFRNTTFANLTVLATTPPTLGTNAFYGNSTVNIYVPSASVNTYKAAEGWSTYANQIFAIS